MGTNNYLEGTSYYLQKQAIILWEQVLILWEQMIFQELSCGNKSLSCEHKIKTDKLCSQIMACSHKIKSCVNKINNLFPQNDKFCTQDNKLFPKDNNLCTQGNGLTWVNKINDLFPDDNRLICANKIITCSHRLITCKHKIKSNTLQDFRGSIQNNYMQSTKIQRTESANSWKDFSFAMCNFECIHNGSIDIFTALLYICICIWLLLIYGSFFPLSLYS